MAQARRQGVTAFFAFIFCSARAAFACPGCSSIAEKGMAIAEYHFFQGVNWSVMFMIFIPYLLIGSAVFFIWSSARKAKRKIADESR